MPLTRYLLYVGGVLLTLLFIADFCLPKSPVAERASIDLPAIRIYSDRKWPDRIVRSCTASQRRDQRPGSGNGRRCHTEGAGRICATATAREPAATI
jgi:hypothetical protein